MALDPNILLAGQPQVQIQNPMDMMKNALTLKSLSAQSQMQDREMQDQQSLRDAYKNNVTIGSDGTPTLNRQGFLSQLTPQMAMQKGQEFRTQDLAAKDQQMKTLTDQTGIAKNLLAQIPTDSKTPLSEKQSAWTNMYEQGIKYDLPGAANVPQQYPGDDVVRSRQAHVLSIEEQNAQYWKQKESSQKDQELANKKQDMDLQRFKMLGGPAPAFLQQPGTGAPGAAPGPLGQSGTFASQPTGGGSSQSIDPAQLVKYQVPEKHQEKAFAEIDASQNTVRNAPNILKAFDDAANNYHGVDVVPGTQNVDQKTFHALLGPTFKDVEGTVRQAAMDNMYKNTTPQFGDSKATLAKKREAVVDYLKSKSAAPTNKGFGIDLTKFPSTNFNGEAADDPTDHAAGAAAELAKRGIK